MQYGNQDMKKKIKEMEERLNRTMQYGNISVCHPSCQQPNEFKSYYVVWKLKHSKQKHSQINGFKSYYVVWKQIFYYYNTDDC